MKYKDITVKITIPADVCKLVVQAQRQYNRTQDAAIEWDSAVEVAEWLNGQLDAEMSIRAEILEAYGVAY